MYLKKATICHLLFFYRLVNEPIARRSAFNADKIKFNQHIWWFINSLMSKDRRMFVIIDDVKKIGQCRLDLKGNRVFIDYSVMSDFRGKGYGTKVIAEIILFSKEVLGEMILVGEVKKDNVPSQKCFMNNGFNVVEKDDKFIFKYNLKVD